MLARPSVAWGEVPEQGAGILCIFEAGDVDYGLCDPVFWVVSLAQCASSHTSSDKVRTLEEHIPALRCRFHRQNGQLAG